MRITVELLGDLQQYAKNGRKPFEVDVEDGTTVRALIAQLGVPKEATWNASLEGHLIYATDRLAEGAALIVFPPLGGG